MTGATTANVSLEPPPLRHRRTRRAAAARSAPATGTPGAPGTGTCDRGARAGLVASTTNSQGPLERLRAGRHRRQHRSRHGQREPEPGHRTGDELQVEPRRPLLSGQAYAGCFGSTSCRAVHRDRRGAERGPAGCRTPQPATLRLHLLRAVERQRAGRRLGQACPGPAAISLRNDPRELLAYRRAVARPIDASNRASVGRAAVAPRRGAVRASRSSRGTTRCRGSMPGATSGRAPMRRRSQSATDAKSGSRTHRRAASRCRPTRLDMGRSSWARCCAISAATSAPIGRREHVARERAADHRALGAAAPPVARATSAERHICCGTSAGSGMPTSSVQHVARERARPTSWYASRISVSWTRQLVATARIAPRSPRRAIAAFNRARSGGA